MRAPRTRGVRRLVRPYLGGGRRAPVRPSGHRLKLGAGLHLVHKPVGLTSREVLDAWRTPDLPWCHGGALDPFAEGLLILLAGPATKLFEHLHAVPKVYVADVAWGRETDTGDAGGRVVAEGDPALATPAALDAALPPLLGWQEQIPPSTSNKRVRGERAWVLHHRGEQVELPPSRVYLHAAEWLAHRPGVSRLRLTSSGGYYVRSLARDLGRAVGARAHLVRLHRTAIGPWTDPGRRIRTVTGPAMVPWMRTLLVGPVEVGQAVEGPFVPAAYTLPEGFPAVDTLRLVRDGELVGLASDGVVRVSIGSVCRE